MLAAGGGVAAIGGGVLLASVREQAPDVVFALVAGTGLIFAFTGVQARGLASRARLSLETAPRSFALRTWPYSWGWPVVFLRAAVTSEPPGHGASFRVAWSSFGATTLDEVPAQVYGDLGHGSVALVACGQGFALGRIDRSSEPIGPLPAVSTEQPTQNDSTRTLLGAATVLAVLALFVAFAALVH